MSEMEHNKGKLVPFKLTEEVARKLVFNKEGDYVLPDYCDTYLDQVSDDPTYYGLAVIKGKYYAVEWEVQRGELYDFAEAKKNADGSIDFNTWHYNGGAHWSEVVEWALEK